MRRRVAVAAVLASALLCALLASVLPALAAPAQKIGFCHRTDAVSNPYVYESTDADSIIKEGHGLHLGPIFPFTRISGKWGDVIPPFDYTGGHYPGLNWTARGMILVSKHCALQIEPPESSTTTTTVPGATTTAPGAPTTPSTAATTTATTAPAATTAPVAPTGGTATSTSAPAGAPTTASTGPTTTIEAITAITALPPILRPIAGAKLMPPLQAVVVKRAYLYVLLGRLSVPQRKALLVELLQQNKIAVTGSSNTQPLVYGAVLVLMAGVAMVAGARRRRP